MLRNRGFTLIEVMITVAIIGILASVALPSYNDYVRRGQIQEAFTHLSDYRIKMEQYYQDNRNYGASAGAVCATDATASSWNGFAPADAKYFTYSCATSGSGQAYTITATGSSARAVGHVYTVNQAGAKATTLFKGDAVATACWLAKTSAC
ncbi:type IV pilin protein [Polaromonas sp.]|uniref:type IV pilin protein n=1 Tax=Polaromonas sp. TaxID=1869339 RepID=UPI0032649878